MGEKIIFKTPSAEPKPCDIILDISDFQIHTTEKAASSLGKSIRKSVERKSPGRLFFPVSYDPTSNTYLSNLNLNDENLVSFIKNMNLAGRRVFIKRPSASIPVTIGPDVTEQFNSKKARRRQRWISKQL